MVNLFAKSIVCLSVLVLSNQAVSLCMNIENKILISNQFQSYLEYDGWLNINLFHALNPAEPDLFTPRGNVTVSNLNSGTFSASQGPLTRQEQSHLKALAQANQIYRLKAIVIGPNGEESTFLTSSKAVSDLLIYL